MDHLVSIFMEVFKGFIVKYNIGVNPLLQQGISEPIFNGDLLYNSNELLENHQFKKIIKCYIKVRSNLDVMLQSACPVLNPITVYSDGFLFNGKAVGQASRLFDGADVKL